MGRVPNKTDREGLENFIHNRNAICSANFLKALKENHSTEIEIEIIEPEPVKLLPPIPNKAIEKAAKIAFPSFMGRVEAVQRATLVEFPNIKMIDLKAQRRTAQVVKARQIAMYLAKTMTEMSLPEIGRRFGGRDHTTVLHAVRKIDALIPKDPDLAAQVERIREMIPEAT